MTKVTIKNAPKNLTESLERAFTFLEENEISSAVYENEAGCPCLIGSYFSKNQRQWLIDEYLNDKPIYQATKKIGHENLTAMTAMTVDQCSVLQHEFDSGRGNKLQTRILDILTVKKGKINGIIFTL